MKCVFAACLLALVCVFSTPAWAQGKSRKPLVLQPGEKLPAAATPAPKTSAPSEAKETPVASDEPAQIAGAFFLLLAKNLVEDAYSNLTKGSKIGERPEELRTLKAKTTEAIQLFGAIHGYELIDDKAVGKNLLRQTYLSLGRDYPLRWRFYFYRADKQWRLVDLRVDDRLAGIFDEAQEAVAAEPKP